MRKRYFLLVILLLAALLTSCMRAGEDAPGAIESGQTARP